jgi:predicted dehydrogenase
LTDCFEFVGVAEDEMKLRLAAEKQKNYQKVTWMSSDEMLARSDIHAIAVEVSEHHCLPAALRCVRAGKHIHLDKPAGESLADFRQLLDEAKAKNLVVQMGYMYRYNPAVQFCIKAVKDGLLGNIFDVDAAMSRYDGEAARKRVADFVGGIPFLLGCHLVDLAVILLGEPKKIHPFLMKTRSDNCIDNSLTVFEYPQGCFATLRTTINEVEGFQQRHLTVRGNKGTIIVQPLEIKGNMSGGAVKLALTKDTEGFKKGYQTIEMPPLKDRYEDQWREFAEVINGKIVNPYTYEHDFMVQKCLLESCHIPF